jgi:hypothetical protein
MSLLAPIFLLGGLAVALPVFFHLIRRTTRERRIFSSLIFLLPSPPRLTRRSRLEHILLLLLRCAVLCLLAIGFARPFLKQSVTPPPAAASRRVVVLVDASASMRRANLWADARDRAEAVMRKAGPADQVALFTFDRQLNPVMTFEQWNAAAVGERAALAAQKLAGVRPGWGGTQAGNALIGAAELLSDTGTQQPTSRGQIVLITDLQEGCHLEPIQGYEWPKGVELTTEIIKARPASNASLQLVTEVDDADPKSASGVRVRVSNAADSKRELFKVGWATRTEKSYIGMPIDVYVPTGQSRLTVVPLPESGAVVERLLLQGDDEEFDNSVYMIPPEASRLNVAYFGDDSRQDAHQPIYFLERAFQETRRQAVHVEVHSPTQPMEAGDLQATLAIVTDPLADATVRVLRERAQAGNTVLVAVKNQNVAPTLAGLIGLERVSIEEARPNNYAMLADIDFRHPLFAPFADPRFSDFTKIHFWKYRKIDSAPMSNARVLAKFDSGDPALLEVPVGKGRVLILASGWHPEDSQLALSTKFVPLMYSILEQSGAPASVPTQYHIGDSVPLTALASSSQTTLNIRGPEGSQMTAPASETNFTATLMPGIYTVTSSEGARRFAVNLDPAESRTAPLAADELERLGAPIAHQLSALSPETRRQVRLQNTELENRQKIWRWFIVATLALLLFETWLAGRTARQAPAEVVK